MKYRESFPHYFRLVDEAGSMEQVLRQQQHWSPATRAHFVRVVGLTLLQEGKISPAEYRELCRRFPFPYRNYTVRKIDDETLQRIVESAAQRRQSLMWLVIIGLMAAVGLRRESVRRLTTRDVRGEGEVLVVRAFIPKKRGEYYMEYRIPFDLVLGGVQIGEFLRSYHHIRIAEPPGYYFYADDPSSPLSPSTISRGIAEIGKHCGIDLEPTDFRRYAITRIASRMGPAVAAAIACHSNITTTQRYVNLSEVLRIVGIENAIR